MTDNKYQANRRELLAGTGITAAALASGCTEFISQPSLGQVQVRLADLRSPNVGATSATLPIVLEFHNRSGSSMQGLSLSATLYINGEPVATSETNVGTIESGQRKKSRLEVIISYHEVGDSVLNAFRQGSFTLALDGEVRSDGWLVDATRTFRVSKEISV